MSSPLVLEVSTSKSHDGCTEVKQEYIKNSSEVRNAIQRILKDEVRYVYGKACSVDAKSSIAYLVAKKDNSLSTNVALSDYLSKFGDLQWWSQLEIMETKAALAFRFLRFAALSNSSFFPPMIFSNVHPF